MNRLNNMNSIDAMIKESFAPEMSSNVAKGSSSLYGWKTKTYNPSWSETPKTRCCSCDTSTDDDDDTE